MVTETPNLKLKKPAGTDLVDVTVLNGNADILDKAVKGLQDRVQAIENIPYAEGRSF